MQKENHKLKLRSTLPIYLMTRNGIQTLKMKVSCKTDEEDFFFIHLAYLDTLLAK